MRLIDPSSGCRGVGPAHQVDLVPELGTIQEVAQPPPPARARRQAHRQHQLAASAVGAAVEHHHQRTVVAPPCSAPHPARTTRTTGTGRRHAAGLGEYRSSRLQDRGLRRAGHLGRQGGVPVGVQMALQAAVQPERLPLTSLGVGAGPARDPLVLPPRTRSGTARPASGGVGEQVAFHPRPHLVGLMHHQRLRGVMPQPARGIQMSVSGPLQPRARQAQLLAPLHHIPLAPVHTRPEHRHPRPRIPLQRPLDAEHRPEQRLQPGRSLLIDRQRQADHRHRTVIPPRRGLVRPTRPAPTATAGGCPRGARVRGGGRLHDPASCHAQPTERRESPKSSSSPRKTTTEPGRVKTASATHLT